MDPNENKKLKKSKSTAEFEEIEEKIKQQTFTKEMQEQAQQILDAENTQKKEQIYTKHDKHAFSYWNTFYAENTTNFFKDRHQVDTEFTELCETLSTLPKKEAEKSKENTKWQTHVLLELGCGVGNTIFPLIEKQPTLKVQALDFSKTAITLLQKNEKQISKICAEVCDLVKQEIPGYFEPPDFITMIFVLSAIAPEHHETVVKKVQEKLRIGGIVYFRDQGIQDFTELKQAKKKAKLKEHFQLKGDGTRVYYFGLEEIVNLFTKCGFKDKGSINLYRLVENKKLNEKMYRVWVQGKFIKE